MGLFRRVLHREEAQEQPCPRCGISAPAEARVCAACGWDLHEGYHSVAVGSRLGAAEDAGPDPAAADDLR